MGLSPRHVGGSGGILPKQKKIINRVTIAKCMNVVLFEMNIEELYLFRFKEGHTEHYYDT